MSNLRKPVQNNIFLKIDNENRVRRNNLLKFNNDQRSGLPVSSQHRKVTDKIGLVIFGIVVVILIPFLIYTFLKADMRRLNHKYDSCGNVCGDNNMKIDGINCSGKDLRKKPFISYDILTHVHSCTSDMCLPGYYEKDGVCYHSLFSTVKEIKMNPHQDVLSYHFESWYKFLMTSLITIVLCTLIMILFRYAPGVIVWGVLILSVLLLIVISTLFWAAYLFFWRLFIYPAIIFTILTFGIIFILYALSKKIHLIQLLYKETAKAIFGIPFLLCLPLVTLVIQIVFLISLVVSVRYMFTAGVFVSYGNDNYKFEKNDAIKFTIIFSFIVAAWGLQIFAGCQYMITAGSVAHWFFKKKTSRSIILTSVIHTMKFHFGTITFGSVIVLLMSVIKFLLKRIEGLKYVFICGPSCCCTYCTCSTCCCCFQTATTVIKYLSKNAYIETAIRGTPFIKSGKQGVKLLLKNAASMIALNSVGDFVLTMTQFVLIVISTGIASVFFMEEPHFISISFLINLFIVFLLFSTFETTVDTLFICFCEDKLCSDGISKPYTMSKNLMKFMEDSKKVYNTKL